MLINRIIGAFTFRRGVYASVEKDKSFTMTAWILVIVVALLNSLGKDPSLENPVNWLIGAVVITIFAIIGFALLSLIVSWVGRVLFSAKTDFGEMVRCLGLAYVWNVIGVLGVVALFSTTLDCMLAPLTLIAWLLSVIASLIAVKEALDLDWIRTIVTAILGKIVEIIIVLLASTVVAMLGFGTAAAFGALPGT